MRCVRVDTPLTAQAARLKAAEIEVFQELDEKATDRMQDGRSGEGHPRRVMPFRGAGDQHGRHVDRRVPPSGMDRVCRQTRVCRWRGRR